MPYNVNAFLDGQVDKDETDPNSGASLNFHVDERRVYAGQARLMPTIDTNQRHRSNNRLTANNHYHSYTNANSPTTYNDISIKPTVGDFVHFNVAQNNDNHLINRISEQYLLSNIDSTSSFETTTSTMMDMQNELTLSNAVKEISFIESSPKSFSANQTALNSTATTLIDNEDDNVYNYNHDMMRYFDESSEDFRGQNFSPHAEIWIVKSWQEILLRTSFIIPIVLLGIVGNSTIIYSICKFKRFRTKPTNLFILNMAIADLLTTIICPTVALFTDIYQFYVLGSFFCRIEGFSKIAYLLVSSYSLIILSVDWLLSVVRPFRTRISIRQSWFALVLIWFLSILMAAPMIHWRSLRKRQWDDVLEVWCKDAFDESKYYWVGMQFFLIYLPTLIMTIVLVVILAQMDKFEARMRRARANSMQCIHEDSTSSGATSSSVSMRYKRRIVKILFFYLFTSAICWTPLQFTILYRYYRVPGKLQPWFIELNFFAQLCASLSSAMNPIIFGFLSQPFRQIVTKSWIFKLLNRVWPASKAGHGRNNINNQNNHHHNKNNFTMSPLNNLGTNNNTNRSSKSKPRSLSQRTTSDITHEQPKLTICSIENINHHQTTNWHTPNSQSIGKRLVSLNNNRDDQHAMPSPLDHQNVVKTFNQTSSKFKQIIEGGTKLTKAESDKIDQNQLDRHVSFGRTNGIGSNQSTGCSSKCSSLSAIVKKSSVHENVVYDFDFQENCIKSDVQFGTVAGNFHIDGPMVEIRAEDLSTHEYDVDKSIRREIST